MDFDRQDDLTRDPGALLGPEEFSHSLDPKPTLAPLLDCKHRGHNLSRINRCSITRLLIQLLYYRPPLVGVALLQACTRLLPVLF
jgi:hypothetical protein